MSKKLSSSTALGALVASSVGFLTASPAFAVADYTVTNCNSDGAGSLAYGVQQINNATGGTIDFSNSLGCTSISLLSFLDISKNTSIVGPTSSTITITNQSNGRFFAASGTGDLTVSNLTFDGQEINQLLAMWDTGATGFSASFSSVHVSNLSGDYGILVNGGDLTITNSTFNDDNSWRPSSFIQVPVLTVTGSDFIGNGYGEGSLLNAQTSLTVSDSTFTNNDVTYDAGSIFGSTDASISNVVVKDSDTTYISTTSNSLHLSGSSITHNNLGGSIFFGGQGLVSVQNNTVAENKYGVGAAVFSADNTVATFNSFVNNEENNQQIGQVSQGSITLGGNIFASDEGYAFRCSNVGTGTDLGGNLFTSQPENCGFSTLPTSASNGASAVVTWDALAITPGVSLASGEDFYVLSANSVARDYVASLTNANFNPDVDQIGADRPQGVKRDAGSIEMTSIASCTPVAKSTVNFAPYSSKLTNGAKVKLRAYARALHASGCTNIKINGYTATTNKAAASGDAYRLSLANKRTLAVKRYLQSQFARLGVHVTITRTAHGAHSPKKSNNTASGRAANRRVEIVVVAQPA
jgi:outer membrane protein OmpA-like peptidoglycan-associated protein